MEQQKKISQYDYQNAIKPFEQFIREKDIRLRTDEYIILHFDGVGMTKKIFKPYGFKRQKSFC